MTIEQLLESVPAHAKDLRLNLPTLLRQQELTPQQTWGSVVTAAIASRNARLMEVLLAHGREHLSPEAFHAARSAAAIMGMNNIYYRFQHMLPADAGYGNIPARLRMQGIRNHGSDPVDFELWCIVASAVNNCHACVLSHEKEVRDKGLSQEAVVAAVRIGAVVHALAVVFDELAAVPA